MEIACPICKTKAGWAENPYRPFCSERCKLVDLGCWAEESYRVPLQDADEDTLEPE